MSRELSRQDGSIRNGSANENLPVLPRVAVRRKWTSHCWSIVNKLCVGTGSSMVQNCCITWSITGYLVSTIKKPMVYVTSYKIDPLLSTLNVFRMLMDNWTYVIPYKIVLVYTGKYLHLAKNRTYLTRRNEDLRVLNVNMCYELY